MAVCIVDTNYAVVRYFPLRLSWRFRLVGDWELFLASQEECLLIVPCENDLFYSAIWSGVAG